MDVDASVMVKVHIGARVVTFMDETSFIRAIHRQIKLTIQVEGGMVGQKSRRNSGFLPPLAADGVYDHNCAVPSTVRHAGQPQERPSATAQATLSKQLSMTTEQRIYKNQVTRLNLYTLTTEGALSRLSFVFRSVCELGQRCWPVDWP